MMVFRGSVVFAAALIVAAAASNAHSQDTLPELPPAPEPLSPEVPDTAAGESESVSVELDMAATIRIPAGTETLALGNPSITDLTRPRAGRFAVVTGKSYGTTNMLALDRDGGVLQEMMIHVKAPRKTTLTVLRGGARETWSCLPRCQPTVTLGDSADYFGGSSGQIGSRNGLAAP